MSPRPPHPASPPALLATALLTSLLLLPATGCKHASSSKEAKAEAGATGAKVSGDKAAKTGDKADKADKTPVADKAPAKPKPPKGVDVKDLDEAELKVLIAIVDDQFDPCGKPRSFRRALEAGDCSLATRLARFVVHKLQQGYGKRKIVKLLLREIERINTIVQVDTKGAPLLGNADAKVTVVAFSDFECPFCRRVAQPLKKLQQHYGFALYFKHFPLKASHPHAEGAAMAARAAQLQGKFWPMHDILFDKAPDLAWDNVKGYAKAIGLDVKRFTKDAKSDAAKKAVTADYEHGVDANVDGTPTFFINGRRAETLQQLQDGVREQLGLAGVKKLPAALDLGDADEPPEGGGVNPAKQAADKAGTPAEGK